MWPPTEAIKASTEEASVNAASAELWQCDSGSIVVTGAAGVADCGSGKGEVKAVLNVVAVAGAVASLRVGWKRRQWKQRVQRQ